METELSNFTDTGRTDLPQPPIILQGSDAPVFKGRGSDDLRCGGCGQLLVAGFEARSLIAVRIECGRCHAITETPPWPAGEPLPHKLVRLGSAGKFLISATVDLTVSGGAISTDQEIARVLTGTDIRPPDLSTSLDLTPDGFATLHTKLDLLTEASFSDTLTSTERAFRAGNTRFLEYPPAWAYLHLRQRVLEAKELDLSNWSADSIAVSYLDVLLHLVSRWQHCPAYNSLSKALVFEFHHAVVTLLTATYLADHGNRVGFKTAEGVGRTPDLFLNLGHSEQVLIEVKAPTAFQWPNPCPTRADCERILRRQLRRARGQIAAGIGGVLTVGMRIDTPDARARFQESVDSLLSRGAASRKLAALVGVHLNYGLSIRSGPAPGVAGNFSGDFFVVRNPRYEGSPFLRT